MFNLFDPKFNKPELERNFKDFFYAHNLSPLFTNSHRASNLKLSYVDAKSVVNQGGSYNKTLQEFSSILNMYKNNKSYEEAVFKIIHDARSFQGMMNKIRSLMRYIKNEINQQHKWNMWNIVWYNSGDAYK